jgi:hypothetical protein
VTVIWSGDISIITKVHGLSGEVTMSLEHSPRRARKKAAHAAFPEDDNRVMTVRAWAALNGFSLSTAERILGGPKSERPIITQLSAKRRGITVGNNRRWQERMAR